MRTNRPDPSLGREPESKESGSEGQEVDRRGAGVSACRWSARPDRLRLQPKHDQRSGQQANELSGTINVAGSDTMVNLAQAWAEKFNEENPGVDDHRQGRRLGQRYRCAHQQDGRLRQRFAGDQVRGRVGRQGRRCDPVETEVAHDGLVVIVNKATASPTSPRSSSARSTRVRSPTGRTSAAQTLPSSCSAVTAPRAPTASSRTRSSASFPTSRSTPSRCATCSPRRRSSTRSQRTPTASATSAWATRTRRIKPINDRRHDSLGRHRARRHLRAQPRAVHVQRR